MHSYAAWDLPLPPPPHLTFRQRQGEIDEALLDMLLSFSDFATFKQAILDYRKVATSTLHHTPTKAAVYILHCFILQEKEGQGVELMVSTSSLTTGKPDC